MDMAHCLPLGAAIHSLPRCLVSELETYQGLTRKSHAKGVTNWVTRNILTNGTEKAGFNLGLTRKARAMNADIQKTKVEARFDLCSLSIRA